MKTVITPEYVKNFACLADKCETNCCHGWDIDIDKATYGFMTKKSVLKEKAQQVFKRTKGQANYARIKLDENGVCPFRASNGLCEVHKAHGHKRLSRTCQTYPRLSQIRGDQKELSLSISCPEAARQVLLNPSAMNFHREAVADTSFVAVNYTRPVWYEQVRQLFIEVLLLDSVPLEERLFILGMTLKQLDSHKDDIDSFNNTLAFCCEKIANGEFSALFAEQSSTLNLHAAYLIKVFNVRLALGIVAKHKTALARMNLLHEQLVDAFAPAEGDEAKQKEILLQGFNGHYQDYINENPHVWLNYFIYGMYQHDFPTDNMYDVFSELVTDFFILRGTLVAIASQRPLQDNDLILAVQTYHRARSHDVKFGLGIKGIRKILNVDEWMLPLMLLKVS